MQKDKDIKRPFVCVAGKNDIAVDVLEHLIQKNRDYGIGVICNKTETGKNSFQKSLRWFANKFGIREYTLDEVYNTDDLILLSTEFDRIVRPDRFKKARLYNIHFSLLPKYKGMFPTVLPILDGEQESGVTLHRIDAGIDTGDIIDQFSFPINKMDCRELYMKCMKCGTEVVIRNIDAILEGRDEAHPQKIAGSTYHSKKYINYDDLRIDLNQTAYVVANQVRAFCFREYQLPEINGHYIIDYCITNTRSVLKPGSIFLENNDMCIVATIDYNIILYYDKFSQLLEYCEKGNLNMVRRICEIRKHINTSDSHGWTPLMVAVYNNRADITEYLLTHGADINAVNNNGTTALMYAKDAYKRNGDITVFSMLLKFGANSKQRDYTGKSLDDYCREEGIGEIGDYRTDLGSYH